MTRSRHLTATLLLCLVAGCGGSSPPPAAAAPPSNPPTMGAEPLPADGYEIWTGIRVPEAWVDCQSDSDCVVVEAGCCDHCNGGALADARAEFAAPVKEALAKVACAGACTEMACHAAEEHKVTCMTNACLIEDPE